MSMKRSDTSGMDQDDRDIVRRYHQRTKHHMQRYAAGPHGLDWASQPDPFRRFTGAEHITLPLLADSLPSRYKDIYASQQASERPLNRDNIAVLLELSLGLSAWKQYDGSRWALRCNPSSGNLHPTEGYVVCGDMEGLRGGVYHYQSFNHGLEQRCACSLPISGGLLIGLSSIHWREAWKYGERAFRYCQHDTGHALAAIRYAAAALGWQVRLLSNWGDEQIARILGLDRSEDYAQAEPEDPELILWVTPEENSAAEPAELISLSQKAKWQGKANLLSANPQYDWPVIAEVAAATKKNATHPEPHTNSEGDWPPLRDIPCELKATTLIRQRRSMQACDGSTAMTSEAFYRLLDTLLPRSDTVPWDAWPYPPHIHMLLFIHRVTGLEAGLYILTRDRSAENGLRKALLRDELDWRKPADCPAHLPFFQLLEGDARQAARAISCHQEIAADGAFSLGMLADFDRVIETGAWYYRRLFWEAGMLGQVLYLEAEAAGIQGTGIGCYFDDAMHDLFGIQDSRWQCLYHFTVGKGVPDTRLQTLPPYKHRD